MMTSRAEFRLSLRQDNADERLTEIGYRAGLATRERYERFLARKRKKEDTMSALGARAEQKTADALVQKYGYSPLTSSVTFCDLLRRGIPLREICENFHILEDVPRDVLLACETEVKYAGYLKRSEEEIEKAKRMEEKPLPPDIDYGKITGLRLEAREKLGRIRPLNFGQAARISGVSPADIAVLMIYLSLKK